MFDTVLLNRLHDDPTAVTETEFQDAVNTALAPWRHERKARLERECADRLLDSLAASVANAILMEMVPSNRQFLLDGGVLQAMEWIAKVELESDVDSKTVDEVVEVRTYFGRTFDVMRSAGLSAISDRFDEMLFRAAGGYSSTS